MKKKQQESTQCPEEWRKQSMYQASNEAMCQRLQAFEEQVSRSYRKRTMRCPRRKAISATTLISLQHRSCKLPRPSINRFSTTIMNE